MPKRARTTALGVPLIQTLEAFDELYEGDELNVGFRILGTWDDETMHKHSRKFEVRCVDFATAPLGAADDPAIPSVTIIMWKPENIPADQRELIVRGNYLFLKGCEVVKWGKIKFTGGNTEQGVIAFTEADKDNMTLDSCVPLDIKPSADAFKNFK